MIDVIDKLIKDANRAMGKKLTTKDRKKMKKGTFCGPGRSFPVNDCKHAATAKAFLGRSKFSSATKKKIAACINRKAKALGCGGDKKAKAYIELSGPSKKLYTSDVFAITKELVEKSIKEPGKDIEHYLL